MKKKRIMLKISYDGTNYYGLQLQTNVITIQGILNYYLSKLLNENIKTICASRTDVGVHALENVIVFDVFMNNFNIPINKISLILNKLLPNDIFIKTSKEIDINFHPRYNISEKFYEYKILNSKFPIPMERFYSYFISTPIDVDKIRKAGKYLLGKHDFKSFCNIIKDKNINTIRIIKNFFVNYTNNNIIISISGNGFLYNMIRILVGTLIEIGCNIYKPEIIKKILFAKNRKYAGPTAPSCGLTLIKINYNKF